MTKPQQQVVLEEGSVAPDFEAHDGDGRLWRLCDLRGRRVVLYFYPADDTPGCTAEACDFRDSKEAFEDAGYFILGISPQSASSHRAFSAKHNLNFPLLVDADLEIAKRYGALRAERSYYRDVPIEIQRSTFVIDENGIVSHALYGVKGQGHVAELRALLNL